jgi:hypothetical protein
MTCEDTLVATTRYAAWFSRVLWLGILINLSFAVPALFTPSAFHATLGLGMIDPAAAIWLRNAGMLLVLTNGFYSLVARDPFACISFSRWSAFARLIAAAFWIWLALCTKGFGVLWWFFATDFSLGLVLGFLLWRASAAYRPEPT